MRQFLIVFLLFLAHASLRAQLQTPSAFLPHDLGETFTPHHLLVDYVAHVAENSPRVEVREYGRTNEGRPLVLAFVSSPENIQNLEAIRQSNLIRTGLGNGEDVMVDDVAIVWLSYSVHGNEAAGSEASLRVLHELADPTNRRTGNWLRNTVVIIDPSVNPDGYNRYTNWYRQHAPDRPDPTPAAREHREPWPGGRVNHYYFDLNRDWAWQTQVESQQRMKVYHRWMPHVHADVHEQGYTSPYYFAPAAAPFHEYVTDWQAEFQTDIGRYHANSFDREGWLYFTRERFDLLYPSYGDTYPTFNGAIGMTYEQAGHSRAGRAINLPNGDTLTLADRIEHHATTSLNTVEIASDRAGDIVSNFEKYFRDVRAGRIGTYAAYVVSGATPPGKLRDLRVLLDRNGIDYGVARAGQSLRGRDYRSATEKTFSSAAGDLVIPARQTRGVLVQALFDPTTFVEDSATYDITAWSIPLAYGLDAYATTTVIDAGTLDTPPSLAPADPLAGRDLSDFYAFVTPWQDLSAARFLAALLDAGVQVRTSGGAFTFDERAFPAGSLIVSRADNENFPDLVGTVRRLATETAAPLDVLTTGFSRTTGGDIGGGNYDLVGNKRVALLAGQGTNANSVGQVWHFFERDLGYPIGIFHREDIASVAAGDYDVLVLTDGRYRFTKDERQLLLEWVGDGGRLILIGSANAELAGADGFALRRKAKQAADTSVTAKLQPYGGREDRFIEGYIPGAIVELELDATHPLAFGLGDRYASLKTDNTFYNYLNDGWNVGRIRSDPTIYGFAGYKARQRMEESLVFGVQEVSRGQVVYLVDNPLFRAFWQEGKFLFANALFQNY